MDIETSEDAVPSMTILPITRLIHRGVPVMVRLFFQRAD
jgi:hypothetical protein